MNITKDESRILSAAVRDWKYRAVGESHNLRLFEKLEKLENKLEEFGKDKRRNGRKSQNYWSDLIKRFAS